jgi:hypothetical protein
LKDLERMEREAEKRSVLDAARVAVECHEAKLAVLQSTHRECMARADWLSMAGQLPSPRPFRKWTAELAAYSLICAGKIGSEEVGQALSQAREADAATLTQAVSEWEAEERERRKFALLARDVLRGDVSAYRRALIKCGAFSELEEAGVVIEVAVTDRFSIECRVQMRGIEVIPDETKMLSASGKLLVKPTPRARLQELFQDYLCSALLRVGREVFACLPVETVTVHVSTKVFDSAVGREEQRTVVSVRFERPKFEVLNFERIDPSDAVDGFESRCDFKASRKAGAFTPVEPLPAKNATQTSGRSAGGVGEKLTKVRSLRAMIIAESLVG